jgi:hypothetical protein
MWRAHLTAIIGQKGLGLKAKSIKRITAYKYMLYALLIYTNKRKCNNSALSMLACIKNIQLH